MLDLRRLRVLRAVVSTGSITGAAAALHYTPSAVSQHVTALERETGTVLLERAGRGVRPTDAALLLARVADDVLARLADAESRLAAMRAGRTGRLVLSSFPSAGAALVPPAVASFTRAFPDVELVLGVAEPDEALPSLRAGDVDVVVLVEPGAPPEDDLTRVHLLDDPYAVLLPAEHRLAGQPDVDLADLSAEPFVETTSAPGYCQVEAIEACLAAGFSPTYAVQADEYPATQGFVAAGLGVALVPMLALGMLHPGLAVRPVRGAVPVRRIYAAVRTARAGEAVVQGALEALREAGRAVGAARPAALAVEVAPPRSNSPTWSTRPGSSGRGSGTRG